MVLVSTVFRAFALVILAGFVCASCGGEKKAGSPSAASADAGKPRAPQSGPWVEKFADRPQGTSDEQEKCRNQFEELAGKWSSLNFEFKVMLDQNGVPLSEAERKNHSEYTTAQFPSVTFSFDRAKDLLTYTRALYAERDATRTVEHDFRGFKSDQCLVVQNSIKQKDPEWVGKMLLAFKMPESPKDADRIEGSFTWNSGRAIYGGMIYLVR